MTRGRWGGCYYPVDGAKDTFRLVASWTNKATGKRMQQAKYFHGTESEAKRAAGDFMQKCTSEIMVNASKVTFAQFATSYEQGKADSGSLKPATIESEGYIVRLLCEQIGRMKLYDITTNDLQRMFHEVRQSGKLSDSTIRKMYRKANEVFRSAIARRIITFNPMADLKPPKVPTPDRESLTHEVFNRLKAALDEQEDTSPIYIGIRILAATGMRRGEVLGLNWKDVDLNSRTITVSKSVSTKNEVQTPKTKGSNRVIDIDDDTVFHLKNWKEAQQDFFNRLQVTQTQQTPVLSTTTATRYDYHNFGHRASDFFKQYDIVKESGKPYTLHELRHTHATFLLSSGMNIVEVSARLGHKDVSTTLRNYAHALPGGGRALADTFGEIMKHGFSA